MEHLRLVSSSTKKEFSIAARAVYGYSLDPKNGVITLYTYSLPIELEDTVKNQWDNWSGFVEQVKARFKESNDDF